MLNDKSFQAVQQAKFDSIFCRPLYENYCFSRLPMTFKRLLTGQQLDGLPDDTLLDPHATYECLIVILLDAFGWRFAKKYLEMLPFLRRFLDHGVVSQMTSQFPSTTVPHLTCLNTGLPVGQAGLFEWYYFEPLVGSIIAPFRFAIAGEKDNSLEARVDPQALFPFKTFYQDLQECGISSTVLYHRSYASSPYTQVASKGASVIPYASYAEAIYKLSDLITRHPKGYYYLYLGDVDSTAHQLGPDSQEVDALIRDIFELMEKRLASHPVVNHPKTALVLTADHGHIQTFPEKTLYVNQLCPWLLNWMKWDFKGHPLAPAGSPRDSFLYIEEDHLEEALSRLQHYFEGKAKVYLTQTLIDQGMFGPLPLNRRFHERMGNIVILPFEKESVFWYEKDRFENLFHGNHGGLTKEEMESIFFFQG